MGEIKINMMYSKTFDGITNKIKNSPGALLKRTSADKASKNNNVTSLCKSKCEKDFQWKKS